jgi:hypothetical protein
MKDDEGQLTHLSSGVVSQLEITLANHLHHKKRAETFKASTLILRIGIAGQRPANLPNLQTDTLIWTL